MKKFFKQQFQNLKWSLERLFSAKKRKERRILLSVRKNRRDLSRGLSGTKIGGERIEEILTDTCMHYRRYFILKASGGEREICEPLKELRRIQKASLRVVKAPEVSKFCTAYEKGASVKLNAERHKKAKHILHIDIKDFFPSINKAVFMKTYRQFMCYNCRGESCVSCVNKLWKIVSLGGGLPIGACTSPFIANRIMAETDESLAKLDKQIIYTRYADDMIFSSQKPIDKSFINRIEAIINAAGFAINHKKTYFMKSRKQVTGILINDGKLSIGTSYKKRLKQDIYNYLTKGFGKPQEIKGRLAWLAFVEPDYAKVIKNKYKSIDKIELQ